MAESVQPYLIDGLNLVGWDVLEVGLRQAWPFVTLASPGEREERRLFIDTDFVVTGSGRGEIRGSALTRLEPLVALLVRDVRRGSTGLSFSFDDGTSLTIADEPNAETNGDIWWLGGAD
jgi:hypothetical protein